MAQSSMEFFTAAYGYVLPAVVGILLTLMSILMSLRVSRGREYAPYRRARRLLAAMFGTICANLILSLVALRHGLDERYDTLIDILLYTPVALIFLRTVDALLDIRRSGRLTDRLYLLLWGTVTAMGVVASHVDMGEAGKPFFRVTTILWGCLIVTIAADIARTLKGSFWQMNNYYSDNVAKGVKWLRTSFGIFFGWGMFSPIASVCPNWVNTIYTALGAPVFVYIGASFINFMADYRRLKITSHQIQMEHLQVAANSALPHASEAIKSWEARHGYRRNGVTVEMMSDDLGLPIAVLTVTINDEHGCTFREYVNRLRVSDAQEMLVHYPDRSVEEIALAVGYGGDDEMEKAFHDTVYVSPSEWRDGVLRLLN